MRIILYSVIENATVTHAASSLALRVDPFILRAAEMLPFEQVQVVNTSTGAHVQTWIEEGVEGSGEVHTASGARVGDVVSILAFAHLHEGQTLAHKSKSVTLDKSNRVVSVSERNR